MTEFETGYPSVRQIQTFIRDQLEIEVKLLTGDTVTGKPVWQDTHCLCLQDTSDQMVTVWRQAIAYHKTVS
ncbi:MAG: RNA-binding protein hfq [Kamptonema sp. SIO4C4]|nr:RNA-binding protein hfq [Kamptonema sp. SIO4C4]